jgi:hypothetical protein
MRLPVMVIAIAAWQTPPMIVIAGLDPAIHVPSGARQMRDRGMDAQVKPGHDN